jgi:hypothetical protein
MESFAMNPKASGRKKRRAPKRANAKKRFAGQNLKGEFDWAHWPYAVKASVAFSGSADCFDAVLFATRIAALAKNASIKHAGAKIPDDSFWRTDCETFGCQLVFTLIEKIQAAPIPSCSKFLNHLGKALDNFTRQGNSQRPNPVFESYEKVRVGRLLPPTSKEVESAYSKIRGREHYSDATSAVRKKLSQFSLHLTADRDIKNFKKTCDSGGARNPKQRLKMQTKALDKLSPLEWPLADLYEALIWKFHPQEIGSVSIVKKALFYALKNDADFHNEDPIQLAKTRDQVCRLIEIIYHAGFEMSRSIATSLGYVEAPARKEKQTEFRSLHESGGFSQIQGEILLRFAEFLEQTAVEEATTYWLNDPPALTR